MRHDFPPILITLLDRFFTYCFVPFYTFKARLVLTILKAKVGGRLRVDGSLIARSRRRNSIVIGENVTFTSRSRANLAGLKGPCILDTLGGGSITIGDHSGGSSVVLSSRSSIRIGNWVKLGANVRVYDHDFHAMDAVYRRSGLTDKQNVTTKAVEIGDDVFVGANAILLKGSQIGNRTIVGAGSVVAGLTVPPDSLVVGNPARIITEKPPRL